MQKGFAPILIILLIAVAVGGYLVYSGKISLPQKTSQQNSSVDETIDWKTFTNSKYKYSIKFPEEYKAEDYDAMTGGFRNATAEDKRVGIYLNRSNPFDNFLEIQADISTKSKTLKELAQANYKENTTHFETKDFSSLNSGQLDGNSTYEYSYNGKAIKTNYWSASVAEAEYKVIFTEKNNVIYSIYFTNTDFFNKILITFKFLDQNTADTSNWKTYTSDKYGYSFQYPVDLTIQTGSSVTSFAYDVQLNNINYNINFCKPNYCELPDLNQLPLSFQKETIKQTPNLEISGKSAYRIEGQMKVANGNNIYSIKEIISLTDNQKMEIDANALNDTSPDTLRDILDQILSTFKFTQ